MDEATGQASTGIANQGRKRRRKDSEVVGDDPVELENVTVTEETPAKKVRKGYYQMVCIISFFSIFHFSQRSGRINRESLFSVLEA